MPQDEQKRKADAKQNEEDLKKEKELREAREKREAQAASEAAAATFPKWKYHENKGRTLVHTEEQEQALGGDWKDTPADFSSPASGQAARIVGGGPLPGGPDPRGPHSDPLPTDPKPTGEPVEPAKSRR